MTRNITILNELSELNSPLKDISAANLYTVPDKYFDELISNVVTRIKAMENTAAEDSSLPSVFAKVSKEMPYTVPAGYFEQLGDNVLTILHADNGYETADAELAVLSPLLSNLKKDMPYSVPQGYFDNLVKKETKPEAKVISLTHRKWFRIVAAAVITGFIVLAGFLVFNNNTTGEPGSKALAKFTKDVKKMDDTQKDDLIDFIDAGLLGDESAVTNTKNKTEIKELLQNIPDEELLDFEQQSEDIESVLFTN